MKSESSLYSRYFTYIKPITKLPIVKNYASPVFTLLTVSILIFFAIKPTIETILVLQKKLSDADIVLQKINKKASDLSLGKTNYDNLDTSIKDRISSFIPDTVNLKSIIQTLEQAANANQASVSALQIQPLVVGIRNSETVGSIDVVSFIFNTEGEYQNLLALLRTLKASGRLISIDSLSMSKTSDDSGLIMSLTGKAYYLK